MAFVLEPHNKPWGLELGKITSGGPSKMKGQPEDQKGNNPTGWTSADKKETYSRKRRVGGGDNYSIMLLVLGSGIELKTNRASLMAQLVKNPPAMQETHVWFLGQEDLLEEENGNPLQYSSLGKAMDREAWWATVQRVIKNWTPLSDYAFMQRQIKSTSTSCLGNTSTRAHSYSGLGPEFS